MGSVMIPWISVLPSSSLMALPVMMDCSARFLKRVPLGRALVLFSGIVLPRGMRAMMQHVMILWISVLPSPDPMVVPVTMVCIVRRVSSAAEGYVLLSLPGTVRR